jgi:nucleotide-binding universal stress UspA family protein
MSTGFEFPVFLRTKDSGEVKAYRSVIDMESDIEEIDVENGEYEAWDASGTPLALSLQQETAWLHLATAEAPQPQQLMAAIAEYARRVGVDIDTTVLARQGAATALDRVRVAAEANRRAKPWWRRLLEHF